MKQISTDKAPKAVGPYSQAISANGFIFCSGQVPLTPEGEVIKEIEPATHQVMKNLEQVLKAARSGLDKVVKTTIYLANIEDYPIVNKIYDSYLGVTKPARATVEVSNLPLGVLVEIECVAVS